MVDRYKPRVELVSDSFEIPQLGKKRKVYVLLPADYDILPDKRYSVLYLQDAQNLFGDANPFGSWEIDKHLGDLYRDGHKDLIVVAVDHGGEERISEYSPYYHRSFGKGQGMHYAEFVIETLKPYIDSHYRTRPEREHNGIGGSSMGGLISAYIGIVHPEHFSKLMIFSPSFWYSDEIYFDAFKYDYTLPLRMYIYGGDKESETMTQHIHKFQDALESGDHMDINEYRVDIHPDGDHTEYWWSRAFPKAAEWLFFQDE